MFSNFYIFVVAYFFSNTKLIVYVGIRIQVNMHFTCGRYLFAPQSFVNSVRIDFVWCVVDFCQSRLREVVWICSL